MAELRPFPEGINQPAQETDGVNSQSVQKLDFDPARRGFLKKTLSLTMGALILGLGLEKAVNLLSSKSKKSLLGKTTDVPDKSSTEENDFSETSHLLEDKEALECSWRELLALKKELESFNLTQEFKEGSAEEGEFKKLVAQNLEDLKKRYHRSAFWYDRLFQQVGKHLPTILEECRKAGVPPAVAIGVALEESLVNQEARSPSGRAIGVMQLEKPTALAWQKRREARDLIEEEDEEEIKMSKDLRTVAEHNIGVGIVGLRELADRFGDWGVAVLAYNNGATSVGRRVRNFREKGFLQKFGRVNYVRLLPLIPDYALKKKGGKTEAVSNAVHKYYPVRVEAKLRLFLEYYLPKLIGIVQKQLESLS
ncbi:MAG: transglycosylase SLT domain-containing protein [Candidatus Magasanikbacteria bacterium]|nr:transglycosylase SLT domain-containing protein [Candidatus Magasanikbacteria bacterium]